MADDIWILSSYFNPCRYVTRRQNFDRFAARVKSDGGRLLIVEMALEGHDFELGPDVDTIQVRGDGVMWQKERLLNIGISQLPAACTKVVWIDCDILFENRAWIDETSRALDRHAVVQPFSRCVHLPRAATALRGDETTVESFAAAFAREPALSREAKYEFHGHTGFAWAARRELLTRHGLYDACLTGSGDHLMAHVFAGALTSPCIGKMIGVGHKYADHFARWAAAVDRDVAGNLGHVDGCVLHLWHGARSDRRYRERNQEFQGFAFDPERHIRRDAHGLWSWADAPAAMVSWSRDMFASRKEDGEGGAPVESA